MASDSFDDFLQAYSNTDLEVLIRTVHGEQPKPGVKRPRTPERPPRREEPKPDNEAAPSTSGEAISQEEAKPPELGQQDMDHMMAATFESRLREVERKQHNSTRGGRNKLYYEVKQKYGDAAAKPFFVPPGLKPEDIVPPPTPVLPGKWWAEAPPIRVPPPPPPPSTSSSSTSAPWRSPVDLPPAPQERQYWQR